MATNTTKLDLRKPGENDFYNQQTEQAENWDKVDKFADEIQNNVDFNLLATLGIEYGGILNNTYAKVSGKAYYDTTGKKLYKCTANTSVNYADAGFFEALSNNDLITTTELNGNVSYFGSNITQTYNCKTVVLTCYLPGSGSLKKNSLLGEIFEKLPKWNLVATSQMNTVTSGRVILEKSGKLTYLGDDCSWSTTSPFFTFVYQI